MVTVVQNMTELKERLEKAGKQLVVIDFFATWCGPCKMIAPQYEKLSQEHTDIIFLKVDVDDSEDIATEYEIASMPTFVFIKEGKKIHSFAGASLPKLEDAIKAHK